MCAARHGGWIRSACPRRLPLVAAARGWSLPTSGTTERGHRRDRRLVSPMTTNRDRDDAGRPRNARPRDATGRPLERSDEPATPADDPPAMPPGEAIELAAGLLADGLAFRAHEVFEAVWKSTDTDRELW